MSAGPRVRRGAAVIFDMDGLMLDTEPISLGAWQAASAEHGYDLDPSTYDRLIGLGHGAALDLLRQHFGDACPIDAVAASAQTRYRAAIDEGGVPLKPGLPSLLAFLDERRVPRAVATSTWTALARDKLARAGVLDRLDVVVGGDQVRYGKPAPDIFLLAARRLGTAPAACLVLEDSNPGARAAAAAGMRVVIVPDRVAPDADTRALAYAIARSLDEAADAVARWLDDAPGGAAQDGLA